MSDWRGVVLRAVWRGGCEMVVRVNARIHRHGRRRSRGIDWLIDVTSRSARECTCKCRSRDACPEEGSCIGRQDQSPKGKGDAGLHDDFGQEQLTKVCAS